ncbi:MAG TPA: carboxypeptidase-like regulatory domain-containing protein [Vicinamibacterales bacterium]|nr:carboxypeptidase-like regulatory domain-containing protein [Vicinamibacterales bacterium]
MRHLRLPLLFALFMTTVMTAQEPGPGPLGRGQGPFPGGRGRLGMPPRDDSQAAPTGNAKITGRVVAADTGSPIRRAQIRVTSGEARFNRVVTTDGDGRYELLNLPAGRYRLFVNRAGYVALEYGQARPFENGKPLDIAEGQAVEKVDFSLPRGSVITGRITDEFGDPMTDVQVQAMRYQFVNGERQLVNAGRVAQTDDLGQFRVFGLMPGDYVVRASLRLNQNPDTMNQPDPVGYPGTYYPGVVDVTQAQSVTVTLGQELSSVAFPLVPARLSRVSGIVMGSDGRPLGGGMIMLRPRGSNGMGALRAAFGGGNQIRPDGSFQLTGVPPGDYVLDVQQRPQNVRNLQEINLSLLEFASMPLTVSGDIDNLTVVTTPGVTMSGRVVFPGQTTPQSNMQVVANPSAGASSPVAMMMAARALGGGRVNQDGTFELRGLAGPRLIRVQGVPSGWALKSVTVEGNEVTDTPFEFKPGTSVSGVVITMTNRLTEVTGGVRDSRGQPVADYVLVAFAEDTKLWGAQSRFVQTARPNQNGAFTIKGLPPGRYMAAVVAALENGMQNDPAVLEQLRIGAQNFSLTEGQTLNLNLTMGPPQP